MRRYKEFVIIRWANRQKVSCQLFGNCFFLKLPQWILTEISLQKPFPF